MSWVAVGVGGAAAAGSIFSGVFGAAGAQKQAGAITAAAETASRTALELNNRARADLAPFREMGIQSGNTLMSLLLGGGDVSAVTKASPLFQFQSEMGSRNINRELASRGLFNSGAGLETLQRFNNQLVGEEADRLFGRLSDVTKMGQASAAGMAQVTNQTGNQVAGIQANAGVAQGNAIANQYNAIGGAGQGVFNAIGGGLNNYAQYQMYKPIMDRLAGGNVMGGAPVASAGGSSTATFSGGW